MQKSTGTAVGGGAGAVTCTAIHGSWFGYPAQTIKSSNFSGPVNLSFFRLLAYHFEREGIERQIGIL